MYEKRLDTLHAESSRRRPTINEEFDSKDKRKKFTASCGVKERESPSKSEIFYIRLA